MKALWQQQAARIDALSLRERVFLFISVIAVFIALADVLWLTPTQTKHTQVRQQFAAQGIELQRLRDELNALAPPVDASKAVREEVAAAQVQLAAVDHDIKNRVPMSDSDLALQAVLVQFLRRHEALTLVSAGTVKEESGAAPAASAVASPVSTGLVKRAMELKVTGPYAELVRYVKTLESALPALRWGALQLKSDKQPPELTLQVYVVGVQP